MPWRPIIFQIIQQPLYARQTFDPKPMQSLITPNLLLTVVLAIISPQIARNSWVMRHSLTLSLYELQMVVHSAQLAKEISKSFYRMGIRNLLRLHSKMCFTHLTWHSPSFLCSALKSGPVSVLLPFLKGPQTGPVSESFRIQELRTGTAKNRSKLVVTSLGMNTIKHVLDQQKSDMGCENEL
jgi:hypothetical protein